MKNPFTIHPRAMNESYWRHLINSMVFSSRMVVAGFKCFVHGFLPFVFVFSTSDALAKMTRSFLKRSPNDKRFFVED